jgi:hypothetical protein
VIDSTDNVSDPMAEPNGEHDRRKLFEAVVARRQSSEQ